MEQNDLDFMLGVGVSKTPKFPIIEVNNLKEETELNGRTVKVLNKDRGYTILEKDDNGFVKNPFAPEFSGVILLVRASLKEKYEEGIESRWYTPEFNQLDVNEIIPVFRGKDKIGEGTYRQIKESHSRKNKKGEKVNDFVYYLNVYVLVGEETYKLRIKGASRSNFFDYENPVRKKETIFKTEYVEAENPYYVATFENGKEVNKEEMDKKAFELLTQLKRTPTPLIGSTPKLEQGFDEAMVEAQSEPEIPAIDVDEEPEIKQSDILF